MTHSALANGIQLTPDRSSRNGRRVDRFIVHHAATASLAAILSLFMPGGRTVSANYALGSDGTLIITVDEDWSAWTSATQTWDGRAITIEVANSRTGEPWPVSDAAFDKLARLIADVATRYDFPINDDTILTHQELYRRYGASYPTACPGDLQRRKAELIGKANYYRAFPGGQPQPPAKTPEQIEEEELMAAADRIIEAVNGVGAKVETNLRALKREGRFRKFGDATGRRALGREGDVIALSSNPDEAQTQMIHIAASRPLAFPVEELEGNLPILSTTSFFSEVDAYADTPETDYGYGVFVRNVQDIADAPASAAGNQTRMVRRDKRGTIAEFPYASRYDVWASAKPVEFEYAGAPVEDFLTVAGQKAALVEGRDEPIILTATESGRADAQRPAGQDWS